MTPVIADSKRVKVNRKREKQTRYLSQAIQLEEAVNPHIIRSTMSMVSLAILCFLVWAHFTNINEVARTAGEVVPHGYQQTVQHLEGGSVQAIHVKEGEVVNANQPLLSLSESGIRTDLDRAKSKQRSLMLKEERLRAFVDNRLPDFSRFTHASPEVLADQMSFFEGMRVARDREEEIIRKQIIEKKQSLTALTHSLESAQDNYTITKEIYDRKNILKKKGYASQMQLLENEKSVNEIQSEIKQFENQLLMTQTAIEEFENRLESLSASHRDEAYEALASIAAEKEQNIEVIHKLEHRLNHLQVRSPARGMVKGLTVNTIGAVIQPGQMIMEIVPFDKQLEVQVRISPKDIGHLEVGQPVQVKFSTYDFSRYGGIEGTLEHISATTFTADGGERYYQGRIGLANHYVGDDPKNLILPGMTVMADIVTGHKTILQYLLKPIHLSLKSAFTER